MVAARPSSPTTTAETTNFFSWSRGTTVKILNKAVACQTAPPSAAQWQVPLQDLAVGTNYAVVPVGGEAGFPLAEAAVGHELCMIVQPDMLDRDKYSYFAGREFKYRQRSPPQARAIRRGLETSRGQDRTG
ncbi:hypothetical protein [Arthrobacter roseus]|uniref:hypothetical protein n=1 Tax=Arthrobacter roseus TaxID=136274 RepID=UPI0019659E66|nr:hypothetical protein [Arthrobacter roseus]MBM7848292.1 hypothetical protein [Arthrobacter roseus]